MTFTSMHRTGLFCVCLILFLFQTVEWSYIPMTIGHITVLGVCLSMILKSGKFYLSWFSGFGVAFLIYGTVGLFWSEVPSSAGYTLLTYILPAILLITAAMSNHQAILNIDLFYKFLMGAVSILALYAIYQYVMGAGYYGAAANYPFSNPNSLAIFLGIGGVVAFNNFINNRSWMYGLALTVIIIGIVTTQSRAAIIIFPSILLMMTLYYGRLNGFKYQTLKFPMLCLGLVIVGFIATPYVLDALLPQENNLSAIMALSISNISPRLIIWDSAATAALSTHPIIGNGIGTFKHIYSEFRQVGDNTMGMHAHNDILQLWVEMGAVGVGIAGLLIVGYVRCAWIIWRDGHKDKILPLFVVTFMMAMAMVSPIILLPVFMTIFGLSLVGLISLLGVKVLEAQWIGQLISLVVMLIVFFAINISAQYFYTQNVHASLKNQDILGFFKSIDRLDAVSLRLNPTVPLMQTSLLLTLYDQKLIEDEKRADALLELDGYIDEATRRNPYNADNFFYAAELESRKGNPDKAYDLYELALIRDPMHVRARLKLVAMSDNIDKKLTLLRDGFNYRYFQQSPIKLYGEALVAAKEHNDDELYEKAESALQYQMRLK